MRRRFFVEHFDGRAAVLSGEGAHHLGCVLRAEPGQLYELSDGEAVWLGRVERAGRNRIEFALFEPVLQPEPRLHLVLLLSIVKFDRFERCLEKATELGAAEIVPLAAARSEKALVAAAPKRARRWQKILLEAAQQSRRLRPPVLQPLVRPADAFRGVEVLLAESGLRILLSERPDAPPLRTIVEGKREPAAVLATGPEGGWTDEELEAARAVGFAEASLGSSILRTETAVIAALAILNYALGD